MISIIKILLQKIERAARNLHKINNKLLRLNTKKRFRCHIPYKNNKISPYKNQKHLKSKQQKGIHIPLNQTKPSNSLISIKTTMQLAKLNIVSTRIKLQ